MRPATGVKLKLKRQPEQLGHSEGSNPSPGTIAPG
jgi:hypothetical protein